MPKVTQLISEATLHCYPDSVCFIYHNLVPASPSLGEEKREGEMKVQEYIL